MSRSLHFYGRYKMGSVGSATEAPDNEYDSTWDDEFEEGELSMRGPKQRTRKAQRNLVAASDMQNFRHMCRNNRHAPHRSRGQGDPLHNLNFYQNKTPSQPDGVYISQFHKYWSGDYTRLERVHSYVQWLFPIQEPGLNHSAHVITPSEIRYFHEDRTVKRRLLKSYKLMLDFYGIQLVSEETGEVQRATNWKERFENLNRNTHNSLRITRILKCLGLLGFHRYQAPLVHFFLKETLVKGTLPQVKQSVLDYFVFAVLDRSKRKELIKYAFYNFEPKELFVWCPRRIQRKLLERSAARNQPSQAPADARWEVKRYTSDHRKWWDSLELIGSQNSGRNSRKQNADHSQIDPRNSRPSA